MQYLRKFDLNRTGKRGNAACGPAGRLDAVRACPDGDDRFYRPSLSSFYFLLPGDKWLLFFKAPTGFHSPREGGEV